MTFAVENITVGTEYLHIALFGGGPDSGWKVILPKDREGYFNPLAAGLVRAGAMRPGDATSPAKVNQAEWAAMRDYYSANYGTPAG